MNYSISTAAYDGYPYGQIFQSLQKLGCDYVEIALIEGYVPDFTEADWNAEFAGKLRSEFEKYGLSCTSLACHANLDHDEAPEYLLRRIRFAKMLGTNRVILNAASPNRFETFMKQLDVITAEAKSYAMKILFENPGDQKNNLINSADDIEVFLTHVDCSVFGINYDPGNLISHQPEKDVLKDSIKALDYCEHLHIKDVRMENGRYTFCPIGQGQGHYEIFFQHISAMTAPPFFSIELPFRLSRDQAGKPLRSEKHIDFVVIEEYLKQTILFIKNY